MLQKDQNLQKGGKKEESVEELLQKLAKKGKKVKLLDESASVKELPRQEDNDDDDERDINERQDIEIDANESPTKSRLRNKVSKIKDDRDE